MPLALINISVNLAAQQYNVFKITVLFSKSTLVFRFVVNIEFPLHCTGFQYIPVCLYEHIICILFLNIHPLKIVYLKSFPHSFWFLCLLKLSLANYNQLQYMFNILLSHDFLGLFIYYAIANNIKNSSSQFLTAIKYICICCPVNANKF